MLKKIQKNRITIMVLSLIIILLIVFAKRILIDDYNRIVNKEQNVIETDSQIAFKKNTEEMFKEVPKGTTHVMFSIGDGNKYYLSVEEWFSIKDDYPVGKIVETFKK